MRGALCLSFENSKPELFVLTCRVCTDPFHTRFILWRGPSPRGRRSRVGYGLPCPPLGYGWRGARAPGSRWCGVARDTVPQARSRSAVKARLFQSLASIPSRRHRRCRQSRAARRLHPPSLCALTKTHTFHKAQYRRSDSRSHLATHGDTHTQTRERAPP